MAWTTKHRFAAIVTLLFLAADRPIAAEPVIPGYLNFESLRVELESIAASDLAALSSLGQTLGGRDVFLLAISSGDTDKKPAILVVGNVSAPHLVGSELAVRLAKSLIDRAASDDQIKKLLLEQTIYIIPRPTPDASEAFFQKPWQERAGNVRPTDDDRDGEINEDPAEDLNGDGLITMMRVEDLNGQYIAHPSDSRVLIKADATKKETGQYRLLIEGIDNDGDEDWGEDGPGGVDFNRNYTFRYPFFEVGAGPHQVSEPETRAVADFCYAHPNIYSVLTFSPHDNLVKPWKTNSKSENAKKKTSVRKEDSPYYGAISKSFGEVISDKNGKSPPSDKGSFVHWAYFHFGRWSLGSHGWSIPDSKEEEIEEKEAGEKETEKKESGDRWQETGDDGKLSTEYPVSGTRNSIASSQRFAGRDTVANFQIAASNDGAEEESESESESAAGGGQKETDDKRGADDLNALRWFAKNDIGGFVEWTKFDHPDFPGKKVEIGGFRPFTRINPPAGDLDGLAEKHTEFFLNLAAMRPRLVLATDKIESLGEGTYRVVVTIRNVGFLPTMSAMGETSRLHTRLQAEITLPDGAELVTGSPRVRIKPLDGSGGHAKQEWLFVVPSEARKSIRITAGGPTLGTTELTVELP